MRLSLSNDNNNKKYIKGPTYRLVHFLIFSFIKSEITTDAFLKQDANIDIPLVVAVWAAESWRWKWSTYLQKTSPFESTLKTSWIETTTLRTLAHVHKIIRTFGQYCFHDRISRLGGPSNSTINSFRSLLFKSRMRVQQHQRQSSRLWYIYS